VSPQDDAHRSAIICIAPPHPAEAYHAVKRAHIVCSLREGDIRLSPHCYNTVEEMERVLDVLDRLGAWGPEPRAVGPGSAEPDPPGTANPGAVPRGSRDPWPSPDAHPPTTLRAQT